jgi:hypothetical protein
LHLAAVPGLQEVLLLLFQQYLGSVVPVPIHRESTDAVAGGGINLLLSPGRISLISITPSGIFGLDVPFKHGLGASQKFPLGPRFSRELFLVGAGMIVRKIECHRLEADTLERNPGICQLLHFFSSKVPHAWRGAESSDAVPVELGFA